MKDFLEASRISTANRLKACKAQRLSIGVGEREFALVGLAHSSFRLVFGAGVNKFKA